MFDNPKDTDKLSPELETDFFYRPQEYTSTLRGSYYVRHSLIWLSRELTPYEKPAPSYETFLTQIGKWLEQQEDGLGFDIWF